MNVDDVSDALSEKEREALRLLLAGHDAKSTAHRLGVSHYAIHDRLRSARLKLGTSSSRQAALLLCQSENTTPDPMVHKPIGGADLPNVPEELASANMKRPGSSWVQRRKSGLIIMSVSILIVAATVAINGYAVAPWGSYPAASAQPVGSEAHINGTAQTSRGDRPAERTASIQARSDVPAREFLSLFDQGNAGASYAAAAPAFRNALGIELWELAAVIRASEGGAQRRILVDVEEDGNPANPAFQAMEILTFHTVMLNGKRSVERVVMVRIGEDWKVAAFDAEEGNKG